MLPIELVGAPDADRPSHGLGRPGANTRHERRITYAPAWRQSQGREKLPGGSLEAPPSIESVGRPPIVTAAGSQRVRRYSRWGIAPEQGDTRTRNQASEAESPKLSRQIGPSRPIQANAPDEGRGGGFQAWVLPAGVFAVTSLPAAAATQFGQPRSLAGRLGCIPPGLGQGRPSTTQAHNRQERTGHHRRDGWRLPTVKGSPTRSWWSARHRSSSARWWGARCWSW